MNKLNKKQSIQEKAEGKKNALATLNQSGRLGLGHQEDDQIMPPFISENSNENQTVTRALSRSLSR